jgi:hypothetical protein
MTKRKRRVGPIGVDSGLLWLGDPCYTLPDDSRVNPGRDWDAFTKTMIDMPYPAMKNWDGLGVCVSTGGDGSYPVDVTLVDGRVQSVTVTFFKPTKERRDG